MTTRESLHDLLDEIPDDRLADAERELERLAHGNDNTSAVLEDVPIDDELPSDEEERAVSESLQSMAASTGVSSDELQRRAGLR